MMAIDTPEDKSKFENIYKEYSTRMYKVAYAIVKNEHDAENIVHDSFLKLIDCLHRIDQVKESRTWSFISAIVRNNAINFYNRENRNTYLDIEDFNKLLLDDKDPLFYILASDETKLIASLFLKLSFPYKDVLYLQYVDGLSGREIAKILSLTPGNVRQISKRAKGKIYALYNERGN